MTFSWDDATKELRKPLSQEAVKPPPQGKFGEYVDGLHVISEANRIFGHDGWSYEITRLDEVASFTTDKGQYRCGWMCTVRATVHGVTREGAAVGNGSGKADNMADVIESAVKEAETDALKRALRTFGNTFGLALYEKDKSKRQVAAAPTTRDKVDAAENADQINSLIAECAPHGDEAKKYLHGKATSLGLTFNKDLKKYTENANG